MFDVIVIGSGHAGIESAKAASRLGCSVLVITISIKNIGLMPCNPAIGGPAKGQIVGEVDALGGIMGVAADSTHLQLKILNRSRGPAVQCLRGQQDKYAYNTFMREALVSDGNITLVEDMVESLIVEDAIIKGVFTKKKISYFGKTVVITTGTFLSGRIHIGMTNYEAGRINEPSANQLTSSLVKNKFTVGRLKTGTPARLDARTIDYTCMVPQPGDDEFLRFSFRTDYNLRYKEQINCYLTHTTESSHKAILSGLDRSPLFQKTIKGTGPRYCPSIEDKIFRFPDKSSHQVFIEPESRDTHEIYAQGLNTSLPEDIQDKLIRAIPGLDDVSILQHGYAVEYDFVHPNQLTPTLETTLVSNLFLAGQINGTSGYEEAAGQGIIAGINAGLSSQNRESFILTREDSFIGTMIDDLISKPLFEPYRMLTSRSEYRLLLRQDNPHFRLSERAFRIGLLTDSEISRVRDQLQKKNTVLKQWKKDKSPINKMISMHDYIKRPQVTREDITPLHLDFESRDIIQKAMVDVKYEGYIHKQTKDIYKIKKLEMKPIPLDIDFNQILGLKEESREKLIQYQPNTIFDAKKISGVNPADIMVLIAYIDNYHEKEKKRVSHETN